jgi:hypothetical protein
MSERETLQRMLFRGRRALQILEEEAAGFGNLHIPAHLQIELEEKRAEVSSIRTRLDQLEGINSDILPDNLPRKPSVFIGRKEELACCLEALDPDERGWGVIIDGIGGIGKTSLALEVAHEARRCAWFDAYLFASAKTTWLTLEGVHDETLALSSLDAFMSEFARLLDYAHIVQMIDVVERRRALLDALRGHRTLLVWDNLETLTSQERDLIAEFLRKLPAPNKAIITSRRRMSDSAVTIRLDKLSEHEAFRLMTEVGRRQPRVAAELLRCGDDIQRDLYEAAGGSPLALHWTLGLVAQKGYSLIESLSRLRNAARSQDLYSFLFADAVKDLSKNDQVVLLALSSVQTPLNVEKISITTGLVVTQIHIVLERLVKLSLVNDLEGGEYNLHPLARTFICSNFTIFEEKYQENKAYEILQIAYQGWISFEKLNHYLMDENTILLILRYNERLVLSLDLVEYLLCSISYLALTEEPVINKLRNFISNTEITKMDELYSRILRNPSQRVRLGSLELVRKLVGRDAAVHITRVIEQESDYDVKMAAIKNLYYLNKSIPRDIADILLDNNQDWLIQSYVFHSLKIKDVGLLISDTSRFAEQLGDMAQSAGFKMIVFSSISERTLSLDYERMLNLDDGIFDTYKLLILVRGEHFTQYGSRDFYARLRQFVQQGGRLFATSWVSWETQDDISFVEILPFTHFQGTFAENTMISCRPTENELAKKLLPNKISFRTSYEILQSKDDSVVLLETERGIPIFGYRRFGSGHCYYLNTCQHSCLESMLSPMEVSKELYSCVQSIFKWIYKELEGA